MSRHPPPSSMYQWPRRRPHSPKSGSRVTQDARRRYAPTRNEMYTTLKGVRGRTRASANPWWRPVATANVVCLGLTSMMTDVSSEMVNSVVPLFLTFQLGFSHFQLGVFNGAYQALAAFA